MSEELETTDESWELACKIVLGNLGPNTAARKIDEAITAAEARGRVDGARLGIEAAARDAETWFPADTVNTFPKGGVVASIRALDPAQIAGGSDAD